MDNQLNMSQSLDVSLWPHIKSKFSEAASYKADYDTSNKVFHITLFFSSGHTQMIYIPEEAVMEANTGMPMNLLKLLDLYKEDQIIYDTLQGKFPEGNSYGFRMIGTTNEWVARINYPDGTYQIVEGNGKEISTTYDRKAQIKEHGKTYIDLQKELITFIEDPEILRNRMMIRSLYGQQESFDSLFEERDV